MSPPSKSHRSNPEMIIGWREWIALPALTIPAIKVKTDTGARSSALHVLEMDRFHKEGELWVSFTVHPFQRSRRAAVRAEARVIDERTVRSSGGHEQHRPVIRTPIEVMGRRWDIDLTLTCRDAMGFRMLLGREAVRGRFLVDPGRSYIGGRYNTTRSRSVK